MIEPEIAFADLSDNAALAEPLVKYPFGASASRSSSSAVVRVAAFTEPRGRVARPPFLEAPAAVAYLSCLPCCFRSRSGITVLLHPIASDASVLGSDKIACHCGNFVVDFRNLQRRAWAAMNRDVTAPLPWRLEPASWLEAYDPDIVYS